MRRHHPKNERIKRRYRHWLQDAHRKAETTIDQAMAAISLFEESTGYKDFGAFHIEQARAFKRRLAEETNRATGKPYAIATVKGRLDALKAFHKWLADQPGYRRRIRHADCEYFNVSANDARIATAKRERPAPDITQVHQALGGMPANTEIQKRDRALLAFSLLTGVRDDALASLSLRHVDLAARKVIQDARDVRTKFRKSFTTWFFPVGGDAEQIVVDWVLHIQNELRFGSDDPLFPQTEIGLDAEGRFFPAGLSRKHWRNADAIRRVFKAAFKNADMPPFNPHSIRKTLARLGERVCRTPEEFKAWSQNLSHENVLTTFTSYGGVSPERQADLLEAIGRRSETGEPQFEEADLAAARRVLNQLSNRV